ncbi:hypothetical protein CR513_21128, partial [Mucuna pruriens]
MSRRLVSMIFLKFMIFAAMAIVLFSLGVSSTTICIGTCRNWPLCDRYCKSIGFQSGTCVPPQIDFCCCSKYDG